MDIAVIGLGRMGAGVAERLLKGGHRVVAHNRTIEKAQALQPLGGEVAATLADAVRALPAPRALWLYLPSGAVTIEHIQELALLLEPGDTIIDGGNSRFSDTVAISLSLAEKGITLVDVGTSGGVRGREDGYCLMIGGPAPAVSALEPAWNTVAQSGGWARVGKAGAGHYIKMVHNAVEYGMMQAYAEGMQLLDDRSGDLDIVPSDVANLWEHGSIVRSFLGQLLAEGLAEDPALKGMGSVIADSGEGKWAVLEALERGISVPVISASLYARFDSRRQDTIARRTINILRSKFGGHQIEAPNS